MTSRRRFVRGVALAALGLSGCAAMTMKQWNTDPPSMDARDISREHETSEVRPVHLLIACLLPSLFLAACQSMADVDRGAGRTLTITGREYDTIWQAVIHVADEHFEIRERDQARGIFTAERTVTAWGYGAWVGIYITPPTAGAAAYTVEVVGRKKLMTNATEQGWEKKVLRDLQDVLDGRPMHEAGTTQTPGGRPSGKAGHD